MTFAWAGGQIHCPNCHFEGRSKSKHSSVAEFAGLGILLVIGIFFPPFLLIVAILFFYFLLRSSPQICPKCKWEHPVPIKQWASSHAAPAEPQHK